MAKGYRTTKERVFTLPQGPIRFKANNFIQNDEFKEMGFCGLPNTGKTYAGIDFIFRRAFDYPGSHAIVARAFLKDVRDSLLPVMQHRFDMEELGGNKHDMRFTLPKVPHPLTGKLVDSGIFAFGLDSISIEDIFKTYAFATSYINEGNTVAMKAHDMILSRLRQDIFHATHKVYDLAEKKSKIWGVSPADAYVMMYTDPKHAVGRFQLDLDGPMPGRAVQKTDWNPQGQEEIWNRYFNADYPSASYPTEEWVDRYAGVKEVYVDPGTLWADKYEFVCGDEVMLKGKARNKRYYVEYYQTGSPYVKLINEPKAIPYELISLVEKRYSMYAFTYENQSRNYDVSSTYYLMENKELRQQITRGQMPPRTGRVFSNYRDIPVEEGGHVITISPQTYEGARFGIGGVDHGGYHAHSVIAGIIAPKIKGIVIYDENIKHGVAATTMAHEAREMMLPSFEGMWWGLDPSMTRRAYVNEMEHSPIMEYQEVLGYDKVLTSMRGNDAFDIVQDMLLFSEFYGKQPMPRILVSDKCIYTRKALKEIKWDDIKDRRHDELVDVADSIKLMCGIFERIFYMVKGMIYDNPSSVIDTGAVFTGSFYGE